MENVAVLQKPPFDKPISFLKLFDVRTRTALMKAINDVRENAFTVEGLSKYYRSLRRQSLYINQTTARLRIVLEIDSRLLFERYFFFLKYRSATAYP